MTKLLPVLILLGSAALLSAQTGSIDPTEEQLTGLRVFEAPEVELIEEKVVDLRRWMPPVGNQSMNDCTAWAVGYGAKSYLEARDQGWRPDAPQRVFSPTFLYNQLNEGKDDGTNFYKMVKFMAENGAATLATAPYAAGDFRRQPTDRAKLEARSFPVLDLILIKDRKSIRRALQRRQVVVFGAHVNPIFLSGRFEVYGADLFVRDCKLRQPNQRHGKHAMVVVGYDDSKGAFLIQNSWGTKWNKNGYAWVDYALFDLIKIAKDDSVFCNWACTIEDVEEPVQIGADGIARPKPLDRKSLKAHGYSDISHYDRDLGKFIYVFSADLRGPKALLDQVEKVTWSWTNEKNERQSYVSPLAVLRFLLPVAGTTQNPLVLEGLIQFKDGKTQKIASEIVGPNPKADFREARIIFRDDYYGPGAGGRPDFWWEAGLDFPLEQRDDIVKVVWNVGSNMNWRSTVQTNTGFNGKPGEEKAIGMCQTPSRISAEIHYIDGGIKTVHLDPKITDDVSEEHKIEVESRRIGVDDDGRPLYSFELTVDRPVRQQFDVDHVVWTLDPFFTQPTVWENKVFQGFPCFGTTSRDFRAIATLHLTKGGTRTLEKWVTFEKGTAYADPDRIEVESWNRYLGRETGTPRFTGHVYLVGDRRALERVDKVFYQEETGKDHKEYQAWTAADAPRWDWSLSGGEEAVLNVRIVMKDGREKKIRHVHRRTIKPNDNIGLVVDMQAKPETYLDFKHQDTHQFTVRPFGPDEDLVRVICVEWYHNPLTRREQTIHNFNRTGFPAGRTLTSVLTKPFELEAKLHYHTGWEEWIRLPMTRLSSGEFRPELSLRAKEKFWGYDEGRPWWQIDLMIARDEKQQAAGVERVDYVVQSIDMEKPYKPFQSTDPDGRLDIRIDRSCTITAEVLFKDGRKETLTTVATADAIRREQPYSLLMLHDNYQWEHPDRDLMVLDAWVGMRSKIAEVFWDADLEYFDQRVDCRNGVPGVLAYSRTAGGEETMTVTLTRDDGKTMTWKPKIGLPLAPINWTYSVRYWGNDWWQVDARAIGDWWRIKDLWKSFRIGNPADKLKFEDVGAWPQSRKRAYAKAGSYTVVPGGYGQDGKLAGATIVLGDESQKTGEELVLTVAPSPFKHELATVPEWVMRITGPERLLEVIDHVVYGYEDDRARSARVTRRWGEFFDGFEHRAYGSQAPAIEAVVHYTNGATKRFSFKP
ncbi:MAG: C1 family peptidase [Planctomycetes bacterium]|nr:C1 family peptidase [Planctomycetota bacterium]